MHIDTKVKSKLQRAKQVKRNSAQWRKSNLRRYHYRVFFPNETSEMVREFFESLPEIDITYHAAEELSNDKRGLIPLPTKNDLLRPENKLVEFYELLDEHGNSTKKIQKVVIRVPCFSDTLDYVYVVAREGFIVSSWAVDKNDIHRLTNSLHKYYCPTRLQPIVYKKIRQQAEHYKQNEACVA